MKDDWRAVHALADAMERTLSLRIAKAIAAASVAMGQPEVAVALLSGVEAVYAVADVLHVAATIGESVESVVQSIFVRAAMATSSQLGERGQVPQLHLAGSFNLTNPLAEQYARERSAALVTAISEQQRATIRTLIARGFSEGRTVQDTAKDLRSVVGLNERQATAWSNYRAAQEAHFSRENFPRTGLATLQERAAGRAEAYREKLIRQRTTMIARSEILQAANFGQQGAWLAARQAGYLSMNARRFWIITEVGACEFCRAIPAMNRDGVGIDDPYACPVTKWHPDGIIMNPGESHPNCRCAQAIMAAAQRMAA